MLRNVDYFTHKRTGETLSQVKVHIQFIIEESELKTKEKIKSKIYKYKDKYWI